jgi:CRISPR/Cas system CMR-associated protein Cmr3 (group 5 of RAMP superfamily)
MMICIKDWEEKEQLTWMDIVPESDEFYTMCEKQLVEAIQKHARVIIEKMKEVRENFELKNADEMTERGTTGVNVEELDST